MFAAAVGAAILALLAAVELGHVSIRLPFPPGVEYDYMEQPPPGSLPMKFDGQFTVPNEHLTKAERVLKDQIVGAETVAAAYDGRLGVVDKYGRIYIATPDEYGGYTLPEEPFFWSSPGRTLGVKFDLEGNLYIANAPLGLLQLAYPGDVEFQKLVLAAGRVSDDSPLMAGYPIEFANAIDIASDGTVYFTSSTDVLPYKTEDGSWDVLDSVFVTIAKGAPAGMLLAHHPANGSTFALMDKLWFANGVAVSHDETYLLVADSIQARIHKYWLQGPKAGSHEVFIDNLPGATDGVSKSLDGRTYWVTIYTEVPALMKYTDRRLVRLLVAWAPRLMRLLRVPLRKWGLVLRLDEAGKIVQVLGDSKGRVVSGIASATEHNGKLFLGTLHSNGIPVLDLNKIGS